MIKQIEEKVVNRLAAGDFRDQAGGRQPGERDHQFGGARGALEFAKAAAIRPGTLGQALQEIAQEAAVSNALFDVLETQKLTQGDAQLVMVSSGGQARLLTELLAATPSPAS